MPRKWHHVCSRYTTGEVQNSQTKFSGLGELTSQSIQLASVVDLATLQDFSKEGVEIYQVLSSPETTTPTDFLELEGQEKFKQFRLPKHTNTERTQTSIKPINTTRRQTTPSIQQLQDEVARLKRRLEGETSQLKHSKHQRVREVQQAREEESEKWKHSLADQKYRLEQERCRETEALRAQLGKQHAAEINKVLKEREEFSKASRDADRERASFTHRLREQILAEAKEEAKKSFAAERSRLLRENEDLQSSRKRLEDELSQSEAAIRRSSEDLRRLTESHERDVESLKKDARKDIIILIDELKAKDRVIVELEKELGHQAGYAQQLAAERDTTREELNLAKLRDVWERRGRSPDKNSGRKISSNNSTFSASRESKETLNSSNDNSYSSQILPKTGPYESPDMSLSRETLSSRGNPSPAMGSPSRLRGTPMPTKGSSLPVRKSPRPQLQMRRTLPSVDSPSRSHLHETEQARQRLEKRCRMLEEELRNLRGDAKMGRRPKSLWTTENMDRAKEPRRSGQASCVKWGNRSRVDDDTGSNLSGDVSDAQHGEEMEAEIGRLRRRLDEQFEEIVELKESAKADRNWQMLNRGRASLPSETQSEHGVSLNSSLAFSEDMDVSETFRRALSQADVGSRESLSRMTLSSVFMGDQEEEEVRDLRSQIEEMESSQEKLLAELHSSKEQNELLEFQLLEASEEIHHAPEPSHTVTGILTDILKSAQEHDGKLDMTEIKQRVDQLTSEKDSQLTDADREPVRNLKAFMELVEVEILRLHKNESELHQRVSAQAEEVGTLRDKMELLLQRIAEKDETILSTNKQLDELLENEFDLVEKLQKFENEVAILEEELLVLRETNATLKSLVGSPEGEKGSVIATRVAIKDATTGVETEKDKGVQVLSELGISTVEKMSDKSSPEKLGTDEEDVVFSDDDLIGDLLPDAELTGCNKGSEKYDSSEEQGDFLEIPGFLITGEQNGTTRSDEGGLECVATGQTTLEHSRTSEGEDNRPGRLHVSPRGDRRERSGSFVQEIADEAHDWMKLDEALLEEGYDRPQLESAVQEAKGANSLLEKKISDLKANEKKMSQVISDQMVEIRNLKREAEGYISKEALEEHGRKLQDKIRELERRGSRSDSNIQEEIMAKMAVLDSERNIMEDTLKSAKAEKKALRDALDREKLSRIGDDKLQEKMALVETNESQLRDLEEKRGEIQELVRVLEMKQQDVEGSLVIMSEEKTRLEADISGLDQRRNMKEEDILRQQSQLEKLSEKEEQLQRLVQDLERNLASITDTREEQSQTDFEESSSDQREAVESLKREIDRLEEENMLLQELKDQCNMKDKLLEGLETEKRDLEKCLNEAESAKNIMGHEVGEKVEANDRLAEQLVDASKRISELEGSIAKLETVEEANVALTTELKNLARVREENDKLLAEISSLEEDLHEASMQKDRLQEELESKEVDCSKVEKLEEMVRDHELYLARKSEEILTLKGKLREQEEASEQNRLELDSEIKLLEGEAETIRGQNQELLEELNKLKDKEKVLIDKLEDVNGLPEKHEKLRNDFEDMLRCKEEVEESMASLEKEVSLLQEKCESLTEENGELSRQLEQIPCKEEAHETEEPSGDVPSDVDHDRQDMEMRLEQLTNVKDSLRMELQEKQAEIEFLEGRVVNFEETESVLLERDAEIEKLVAEVNNRQKRERELEEVVKTERMSLESLSREVKQAKEKIARCDGRESELLEGLIEKDAQLNALRVRERELQAKLEQQLAEISLSRKDQPDITEDIAGLEARKVRIGALEEELQQLQFGGSDMFGSSDDNSTEEELAGDGRVWRSSRIGAGRSQPGVISEDESGLYSIVEQEVWEEVEVRQTSQTLMAPPTMQGFEGSQRGGYTQDSERENYNRMLNEQIERLEAEVRSQKKMLEQEVSAKEGLQEEIMAMLQSESDLKEQLSTLLEQNDGLQENLSCLREVESELDSLKTLVEKLTEEKRDLQMRLEDAEIFQEGNSEKLQEKAMELDQMKEEVDKMGEERGKLMEKVREMESNMKAVANDLEMGASLDLLSSGQRIDVSKMGGSLRMEESLRDEIRQLEEKNSILEEQLGDRTRISLDTSELDSLFFSSDEDSEQEEGNGETMDEKVKRLEKLNHALKSQVKHLLTFQEFGPAVRRDRGAGWEVSHEVGVAGGNGGSVQGGENVKPESEDQHEAGGNDDDHSQSNPESPPVEEQLEMPHADKLTSNKDIKEQLAISEENNKYLEQQLEDLKQLMQDGGFENQDLLIEKVEGLEKSQKKLCEEIEFLKRDLAEKEDELMSTKSELLNTQSKFSLRIGELEESEQRLLENLDSNNEKWKLEAECSMERIEELESTKGDLRKQLSRAKEQLEEMLASQSFGSLSNTRQSGLSLLDEGLGALDIGRNSFDQDEVDDDPEDDGENAGIHREMEDALRLMDNENEAGADWMGERESSSHRIKELEKSEAELLEKVNVLEEKERVMSDLCEELEKDLEDKIREINDLKEALKLAEGQVQKPSGDYEVGQRTEIGHLHEQIVFMKEEREQLLLKIQQFSSKMGGAHSHQKRAHPERAGESVCYRSECEIGIMQCQSAMTRQFGDIEEPARACSVLKISHWGMGTDGEHGTAKPGVNSVSTEQEVEGIADTTDSNSDNKGEALDKALFSVEQKRPEVSEFDFAETIMARANGTDEEKSGDHEKHVTCSTGAFSDSLSGSTWFQSLTVRKTDIVCLNFDGVIQHPSLHEALLGNGDVLQEARKETVDPFVEPLCSQEEVLPFESSPALFTQLFDESSSPDEVEKVPMGNAPPRCPVCGHSSKISSGLAQDVTITESGMIAAPSPMSPTDGHAGKSSEGSCLEKRICELEHNEVSLKGRIQELEARQSDVRPENSLSSYVKSLSVQGAPEVICRNVDEVIIPQSMAENVVMEGKESMGEEIPGSTADHCAEPILLREDVHPAEMSPDLFVCWEDDHSTGPGKESLDARYICLSGETNDARLKERIQELEQNEMALNEQIAELEMVQGAFEETLSQADVIMKEREAEYISRIQQLESLQSGGVNEQDMEEGQEGTVSDRGEATDDGGLQQLKDRIDELENSEMDFISRIQELKALQSSSNSQETLDLPPQNQTENSPESDSKGTEDSQLSLQKLKDRIEELEDSEMKLMNELEESLESEEKLKEEITRVAAVLCDVEEDVATRDSTDDDASNVESKAMLMRERNQSLALKLAEEGRELQGLKEEIESLKEGKVELEQEVASLREDGTKMVCEVESMEEDKRRLEECSEYIHSDLAKKDKLLTQMREDMSANKVLGEEFSEKVEALEIHNETLGSKLESANRDVNGARREMELLRRGKEKAEKDCENLKRQLEVARRSDVGKNGGLQESPSSREEEVNIEEGKSLDPTVKELQEDLHLAHIQIEDLKRGKIALEEQLKKLRQNMVSNNMVTLSEDEYQELKSRPPCDGAPYAGLNELNSADDAEQFANAGKLWVKLDQTTKELRKYQELYNTTIKEVGHLKQALKDASDKHEAYLVDRAKSSTFTDMVPMSILDMDHKTVQTDPPKAITTDMLKLQLTASDGHLTTLGDFLKHHLPEPSELDETSPHRFPTRPPSIVTAGQDLYLVASPPQFEFDTPPPETPQPNGLPTPTNESPELPPLPERPPPMELSFIMEEGSVLGGGLGEAGFDDEGATIRPLGGDEVLAAPGWGSGMLTDLTGSGCLRDLKMSEWKKVMEEAEGMKDKVRHLEEKIKERDAQLQSLQQRQVELSLNDTEVQAGHQLQEELAAKEAELAEKMREVTRLKGDLKRREAEATPLKLELERLRDQYKDKEQSMRLLEAEQIRLKEKLAERERALFLKEREVEDLKNPIRSLQQGGDRLLLMKDIGVGSDSTPEGETGDGDQRGEMVYLQEQNDRLRRQVAQLEPLKERMANLETQLDRGLRRGQDRDGGLTRKLQLAERQLKERADEELRLSENNMLLQRQISRLERERAHLDRLEAEYTNMKDKFNDLEYRKYEAELSVAPLKAKVSYLTKKFHEKDALLRTMAANAAVRSPERASEIFREIDSLGHQLQTGSPDALDSASVGGSLFSERSPVGSGELRHRSDDDHGIDFEDDLEVSSGAITLQDLIKEASRPTTGVHSRVGMSRDSSELSDIVHGRKPGFSSEMRNKLATVGSDDTVKGLLDGGDIDDLDLPLQRSRARGPPRVQRNGLGLSSRDSQLIVPGGIDTEDLPDGRSRYLTDDDKAGFDDTGSIVGVGQMGSSVVTGGQPSVATSFSPSDGQQTASLFYSGLGNNSMADHVAHNPGLVSAASGVNSSPGNRSSTNIYPNPERLPVSLVPVDRPSGLPVNSSTASGPLNSLSSLQYAAPHLVSSTDTVSTVTPTTQQPFAGARPPSTGVPDPPRALNVARMVSDWSVLLVWKTPLMDQRGCSNGHQVAGYRVYVDGRPKQFATSPHLTKALVTNVNLQMVQTFGVQTVSVEGRASFIREIQFTLPRQGPLHGTPDTSFSDSAREPSSVPSSPMVTGRPKQRMFMAVYSYNPAEHSPNLNHGSELSFKEGDLIEVRGHVRSDGFYNGMVGGKKGLVPSNFIEEISTASLSKKKKRSKPHRLPENSGTRRGDMSGFTQQQRTALRGSKV